MVGSKQNYTQAGLLKRQSGLFQDPRTAPELYRAAQIAEQRFIDNPTYQQILTVLELYKMALVKGDNETRINAKKNIERLLAQFNTAAAKIFRGDDKYSQQVLPHISIRNDEFNDNVSGFLSFIRLRR